MNKIQPTNTKEWSNVLLDFLLEKRKESPTLKFWLRQVNRKNRLNEGLWFQSNDNYIFVGFYNRSGGVNMTRSVGFVVGLDKQGEASAWIEIVYPGEKNKKVIDFYQKAMEQIGGFEQNAEARFERKYPKGKDIFDCFAEFLTVHKPIMDKIMHESNLAGELEIKDELFEKSLNRVLEIRAKGVESPNQTKLGIIMANITWSSNNWTAPSDDESNHRWVKDGNIPHESWNFDFENPRNPKDIVLGFCQWTNAPRLEGDNNLVIFHSQGKIVGFYGKASFEKFHEPINDQESYNIVGYRNLSIGLENKIEDIKAKGYLEDKQRMGQNGFIYLKKSSTAINILFEAKKLNPESEERINNIIDWVNSFDEQTTTDMSNDKIPALNQILFGPPGTGKTYNTINEALKIVDPEFYEANVDDREALTSRYRELLITDWENTKGQIAFCTFHQAFSYEDFVEGIKPDATDDKRVFYEVKSGVFKNICKLSEDYRKSKEVKTKKLISWSEDEFEQAVFYKVSLGDINDPSDNEIYDYCIENGLISIGFGGGADYTNKTETEIRKLCKDSDLDEFHAQALNYFIHYLKKDNYVVIGKGNKYVRAIGRVTGDYVYKPDSPIRYNNFRKVEWIFTDEEIPVAEIYNRSLSMMTIYKMDESGINKDFFVDTQSAIAAKEEAKKSDKKFVLIIDEINRGNVSSIFGELITLIEDDKREGKPEQLEVTLPYSKQAFKVPDNVYLLGTMNTADRSIEALDTALRRRFSFIEKPPVPMVIADEGMVPDGVIEDVDLVEMLDTINQRIEKLIDKDHTIGHSYFLNISTLEELKDVFYNKVIPLLQEYFYGDFGKIGLVLGESFVALKNGNSKFAKFSHYDGDVSGDLEQRKVFEITDSNSWSAASFKTIYE